MRFLDEATKFLEIKSVCEEGNEELINFLIPKFEELGAKLILQQVPHSLADHSKRQFNLIGILGDDLVDSRTKKGFLLTTHIDTPAPGNLADWTKLGGKPWASQTIDQKIYGLGSAHSKLDFLCKLQAFSRFVKMELKQPIYLAATCGGESSLLGCRYLIQSGAVNPKYVLVGHPTNLALANSARAQMSFQIRISFVAIERDAQEFNAKIFISSKGKSGYSVNSSAKDLALQNIFFILDQLKNSPIPIKLFSLQSESNLHKVPDHASVGVVIPAKELEGIRDRFKSLLVNRNDSSYDMRFGGTGDRGIRLYPEELLPALFLVQKEMAAISQSLSGKANISLASIKPDRDSLNLVVHYSLSPEAAATEQRKEIEMDFKNRMNAIAKNYKTLSFDYRKLISYPNFFTDPQGTFTRTLSAELGRVGVETKLFSSSVSTEAAFFSEKGYDTLAFGPGTVEANAYMPNENVDINKLQAATRFYEQAIDAFCVRGI